MNEIRYIISDASKRLDVEPHVLRYWEEELSLKIPRNELGHRYYREEDLHILKSIKSLKAHGFSLRAIKMVLPEVDKLDLEDTKTILKLRDELIEKNLMTEDGPANEESPKNTGLVQKTPTPQLSVSDDKMVQFKHILGGLISNAIMENNKQLSGLVSSSVSESVIKELDYILRVKEEKEEERYRHLDETIRNAFKGRQEAAATTVKKKKRKLFFNKSKS